MKYLLLFCVALFSGISVANDEILINYLTGQYDPSKDKRFTEFVKDTYLRTEALNAFMKMQEAAHNDGIALEISSAMRTYIQQKRIWDSKWKGDRPIDTDTQERLPSPNSPDDDLTSKERAINILQYSAIPGASRHHWGTDIDLNSDNLCDWKTKDGLAEYR